MEAVYLKGGKDRKWCSKKETFKTYFSQYSQELNHVFKDNKFMTSDIFKELLPKAKGLSIKEIKSIQESIDPGQFKVRILIPTTPSTTDNNLPSTSKESLVSNSKTRLPSTSKKSMSSCSEAGSSSTSYLDDYPNSLREEVKHINCVWDEKDSNNESTQIKKKPRKRNRKKSGTNIEILPNIAEDNTNFLKKFEESPTVVCYKKSNIESKQIQDKKVKKSVEAVTQSLDSILKVSNINSKRSKTLPIESNKNVLHTKHVSLKNTHEMKDVINSQDKDTTSSNTLLDEDTTEINTLQAKRRSRRKNKNKIDSQDTLNKSVDIQVTKECDGSIPTLQSEFSKENATGSLLSLRDEINKVKKRGTRMRRKTLYKDGLVFVDTNKKIGKKDLLPRQNFVVSFRVHKPFKHIIGEKGAHIGRCAQEIDLLNYQTLADLRNKIFCEADCQDVSGDVSEHPEVRSKTVAEDEYKSGMFYFDNTFYVDTQPGAEDYSVGIREWAQPRGIELGETKAMDEMRVEDLEVRLGYPYVYKHQGSCEHLVIISGARLLTLSDSLHSSDYPNIKKISRSTLVYCGSCIKKPARWVVSESDRMLHDFNMMCDSCLKNYHYIGDQKIGNFKAYYWKQRALLYA